MILDKEIEIKIFSRNASYWKSKGYSIPPVGGRGGKNGTHILLVKVEDLKNNSNIEIRIQCDKCGKIFKRRWSRCNNHNLCATCFRSDFMKDKKYSKPKYETPTYEELYNLRFVERKSNEEIAKIYGVTYPVIHRWERELNLAKTSREERKNLPKDDIVNAYINGFTASELSKIFKTSPLKIKKIIINSGNNPQYKQGRRKAAITKEDLYFMHVIEKMTFKDIAIRYNLSDVMVGVLAKQWKIENIPYGIGSTSKRELDIQEFLKENGFVFEKKRGLFKNQRWEIDLYNEELRFAIEFDGLFWHKEKQSNSKKYKELTKKGIRFINIFEDEWDNKKYIVKSILLAKLGKFKIRIPARKCVAKEIQIKEANEFFDKHHLQGKPVSSTRSFGLFFENEIVGCISIGKHHRQGNNENILSRVCFKSNTQIHGGLQKLLKLVPNEMFPLVTWSDNRWSNGDLYKANGFSLVASYGPDYSYCKRGIRKSKQSMTKRLTKCPEGMTEFEWNSKNGWYRIWDCGKKKWKLERKV